MEESRPNAGVHGARLIELVRDLDRTADRARETGGSTVAGIALILR